MFMCLWPQSKGWTTHKKAQEVAGTVPDTDAVVLMGMSPIQKTHNQSRTQGAHTAKASPEAQGRQHKVMAMEKGWGRDDGGHVAAYPVASYQPHRATDLVTMYRTTQGSQSST